MKAEISREGDITIVHLKGHLDFETAEPFRRTYLQRLFNEKVVFNFQELNFVGSSGITMFFDLLREFAHRNDVKPKFCGLGSEFKKIFAASQLADLEIYDSHVSAVTSFTSPSLVAPIQLSVLDDPWIEDDLIK
jgi:anti-anti-sigma factor